MQAAPISRQQSTTLTTPDRGLRTLTRLGWRVGGLWVTLWALLTSAASAQFGGGAGGWMLHLYGMVQVEPGANVLTLEVKNEEIRFVVHDVHGANRDFSVARFLSDTKHRTPSVHIKGPDALLDILLKEKPSKRVLKLSGLYYPDARLFVLNELVPFQEKSRREF